MTEKECGCCRAYKEKTGSSVGGWFHAEDHYEWFRIVPTKDSKGHELRLMVVSKRHAAHVGYESEAKMELIKQMLAHGSDFAVFQPTHATIPDHWHIVASTLGESNASDTYQIQDTDRIEIRFKYRVGKKEY